MGNWIYSSWASGRPFEGSSCSSTWKDL